ncbi:tetraspanin-7-like [Bombus pascuorum]|uniref:tetraspanin-7-like n=1 Tax=Bombus pascuorum TaxID=65598 RepID=UPI00212E6995|nr:tetraspanin-7-like [Bombus pascuorum]
MRKDWDAVATMGCLKVLLIMFNCFMWLFGILLLTTAIWMRIQLYDVMDVSSESTRAALLALACLSGVITLAAVFACCCTIHGHSALLFLYGAFLAIVALLVLTGGASIYAYRATLNEKFDHDLNQTMSVYKHDEIKTIHIDTMQSTLQCCGNRGFADWSDMSPPMEIPLSCCKVAEYVCNVNDVNDIYTEGCYTRVLQLINCNIGLVAKIAIGVAFFPLIGVFLACCLANKINKTKYEQVA